MKLFNLTFTFYDATDPLKPVGSDGIYVTHETQDEALALAQAFVNQQVPHKCTLSAVQEIPSGTIITVVSATEFIPAEEESLVKLVENINERIN